ncbi:MAG: hypothetical protein NXY57DRAFT_959166 [Lentinula lateritia]|nr:MAG: hypothetical protein NXY57DRAFT_959166 [Lentinula lateritia]
MSTQPQQTAQVNSTSPSKASDGVESVRKPGSIALDQVNVVQVPANDVPFKERVIGVAKKTRGTVRNPLCIVVSTQPEVKEHGERILQGSASVHEP